MISIVFDDSIAAALKSSSVSTTNLPFVYSYPLTISFHSTASPSFSHTRSYLIGDKSVLCKRRKLTRSFACTAECNRTGMFTRPNVRAPDQIGRIVKLQVAVTSKDAWNACKIDAH